MTARLNDRLAGESFQGLLAALRLAIGAGAGGPDRAALRAINDWSGVARAAARHRVGPLLLRGARRAGLEPAGAELARLRDATVAHGLQQLAGLHRAVRRLEKSRVPALVLKGLPLSQRLFGTPLARNCYDIDLLVPPAAVADAESALSLAGWRLRTPSFKPTPARTRCYNRYVKDRQFAGPGGVLELHHRLTSNPHLFPVRYESLSARAAAIRVGGSSVAVLGDSDLLVYLCLHGQMHRWSRLKWLCDVAALIASMEEAGFGAAVEHCRRHGMKPEPVFGTALRLSREVLRAELPAAARFAPPGVPGGRAANRTRRIWRRPRGGQGLRGAARRIDELWTSQVTNPSWRSAAHELARLCAAPYDLGRVNLPDRLFFLYLPLRPVLWLAGRLERK